MTEPTQDTLTRRLDRLELENRNWRRIAVIVVLVGLTFGIMGQAGQRNTSRVIEGTRLILRDDSGKPRLIMDKDGLYATDQNGVTRFVLSLLPSGTGLILYDSSGEERLLLAVANIGLASVTLYDKGHKERAVLEIQSDGRAVLNLKDPNGHLRLGHHVTSNGPSILLADATGNLRTALGHTSLVAPGTDVQEVRPESSLVFFNRDGKVSWKAP